MAVHAVQAICALIFSLNGRTGVDFVILNHAVGYSLSFRVDSYAFGLTWRGGVV